MTSGGKAYYFQHDGLGSVVNVTSSTGATEWTYDYLPFGGLRKSTKNDNKAPANVFNFSGQLLDPTGLYDMRARQYDPATGRFLATDPVPNSVGDPYVSAYLYARANPVRYTDPSGRCLFLCAAIGAVAGAVIGGVTYALSAGDSFSVGGLAGHAAVGAVAGAIIGFTGGAAAEVVLPAFETAVMVGTGGYVAGIAQTAGQVLLGDRVTARTYVANEVTSIAGALLGGVPTGSWLEDLFSSRALAIDAGSAVAGVVFK